MNKKKNTSYIRLIIQILFLIMMPGLFTLIFGQLKQIYTASIKGNFELGRILPMSIEIFILIPLTIMFGRFFCGYICAFGTINDLIYKFSSNVLKIKFKINKRVDKFLKLIKYAVLLFIVIFIWTLGNKGLNGLNPWDAFAQIIQFPPSVQSILSLCVLILVLIGALFIERFFCRYLCPLGAFLSLIQVFRIVRISKNKSNCLNGCNLCSRSCSMGIDLEKIDRVDSIECIQCMNCSAGCLGNNAKVSIKSKTINEVAVMLIFVFTFIAFRGLAVSMINNNTSKIDTVSGATRTSVGIINAVADALKQAKK
ncbi:FMN-binding domain-containing protein [Caloramator quimbayensis]|uniref:FMN-binding domain-containing protein n=1 Tax=Caloramator quimbayensis TaxID=1147123 RepID=A0A1T4XRB5_9CLOT|nr:4Fe-4S binding protein [Caloramator quimbayensis]SKA91631.1 FMN-binding domain-containing protein [Caloramator quimbayensis]